MMEAHPFGNLVDHATFNEVLSATHEVPPPPSFWFGTMPADVASTYFSRSRLAAAGVYRAREICVGDGFVLSVDGCILIAPQLNIQRLHVEQALTEFGSPPSQGEFRRIHGTCVLITGPGYKIYGHWLADMLPRLAIIASAGVNLDAIRFLVPHDIPRFADEMLNLLGFGHERRVYFGGAAGSLLVDELLLPSFLHNGVRYSSSLRMASAWLRERVAAKNGAFLRGNYPTRILVARVGRGQRTLVNRETIEMECVAAGFSRVQPEVLPLLEQWRLFAGADEILGEYGSALHASLFSEAGTVVCGLRGSLFHPAFIQSGFGEALEQPTGYIFGETLDRDLGRFQLQVKDLRDCLSSVFGQATFAPARFEDSARRLVATETLAVDFARRGNSAKYRQGGWSAQEKNHVWSVGHTSTLRLPPVDALYDWFAMLDVAPCIVSPVRTSQSLQVEVNGHSVGSFLLTKRETLCLCIPRTLLKDQNDLKICFVHLDAVSPKSAGAGSDDRKLAISFHKLTISSSFVKDAQSQ